MSIKKHLFMWLTCLFFSVGYLSAQSNINIAKNNITVRSALYEIEKQSGYSVAFDEKTLDGERKISLSIKNGNLEEALQKTLEGTGCSYSIKNKHIIITPKSASDTKKLSDRKIKGTVIDQSGEPLVGVSVSIDGSANGTMTDIDGSFSLNDVNDKSTIKVSYIGYHPQNIPVGKTSDFTVKLIEDTKMLDEIVIVGYNAVKKKDLTTSVAVVSTEDLNERPIVSAAQALQGKAAGVQVVQPSGRPGGGFSVRVRGATSIEAGNEPLYVVDGLPMTSISNLSANDIESMQVLKDASSAAIYGARAANGVVLITTKRGKVGSSTISFSTYAGFSKLGKKINALNTEEYKDYMKDLKKYVPSTATIPDDENRYTNWTDKFYGTGSNQNYQLSLASGSEKTQYFISMGYTNEQGIVKKATYDRYNFRANIDHKQTDWLKIGLNVSYSSNKGSDVYESRTAMRGGSILSVINTPPYMQKWDTEDYDNPKYDEFAYGSRILTPFAANAADQTYNSGRFLGSLNLDFTILKELHYKIHFGVDEDNSRSMYYLDPNLTSDGRSTKGRIDQSSSNSFEWLLENLVTYDKKFNNHHNLSLLGGSTIQRARAKGDWLGGYDLVEGIKSVSGANIIDKDAVGSSDTSWSLASFLARVAYDYDSKYLVSANIRADGSSKFAPGHRWGIFPSLSAGWRISSEPFMEGTKDVISDLKIRFGWGLNGNQEGIGNFAWKGLNRMERNLPTTTNPLPGMSVYPVTPGNSELTWETTTQYNAGIDLSMFNSRLVFTIDAYHKYTKDLLMTLYLPSTANIPNGIVSNPGAMRNMGLEFAVSSQNFDNKRFKWSTDFNISFNKNKVMDFGLTPMNYYATLYTNEQPAIILKRGLSLGTFYGYVSKGVDPETGDIMYEDRNNNGIIDPEDRTVIGNAQPDFTGGITNTFSYSNFSLSVFFQGSYGNDIYNASKIDMTGMLDFRNQSSEVLRRWRRPGMETDVPRPGNIENVHNSTRFVEDGSYLRLKNVTLSYDFNTNKGFLQKMGISKLQPYVTAQNLWTWTNYSGYDPEVNSYGASSVELGVDYGTYPQSKSIIFGLNLEF